MPLQALDAGKALGALIQQGRIQKRWTMADLSGRLGVSAPTLRAVEAGSPSVSIGTYLHAAVLTGVPLFQTTDPAEIAVMRRRGEERTALLPARVRASSAEEVPDDF